MRRILSILLCLVIVAGVLSCLTAIGSSAADTGFSGETRSEDMINGNSYNRYEMPTRNYLCAVDNGFMRVFGSDDGTLLAEYYDKKFRFISNRTVDSGLSIFGGFYDSGKYYFVVTGERNPEEDPDKEVIRVTRFDKDWNPKGYDSLYGGNTTRPFIGSHCAMASYGDYLIMRCAHEMFNIGGVIHQANFTLVVNMSTMQIANRFTGSANILAAGYLSHSLNQYVAVDTDGTVVCLDHGDAYPRSATLGRFYTKADRLVIYNNNYKTFEYTELMQYYGTLGDNITAAMIGGLECTPTTYLTVGTCANQNSAYRSNKAFNAYLTVTDKSASDITKAKTDVKYLTSFSESDERYASNPHLVRINDNKYLIMWNEFPTETYVTGVHRDYDSAHCMKYVFVDSNGELLTKIMTAPEGSNAFVSECTPIVSGGSVIWYVSDGKDIDSIVCMDFSGKITVHENVIPDSLTVFPVDLSTARVAFRDFDKIPSTVSITRENLDQYVVVVLNGRPLVRGRDYELAENTAASGDSAISVGYSDEGFIRSVTLELRSVTGRSYFPIVYSYNWTANWYEHHLTSIQREDDGVHLSLRVYRGTGYHIYRSADGYDGEYEYIGTVNNRFDLNYVDTTARRHQEYYYAIREYTFDVNGNEVLSDLSYPFSIPAIPSEPLIAADGTVLLGDADMDREVTIIDATTIQRWLAALIWDEEVNKYAADSDLDCEVSILDATAIQRWLAGFPSNYPIGERTVPAVMRQDESTPDES